MKVLPVMKNVPWGSDYKNVVNFNGDREQYFSQYHYFMHDIKKTFDNLDDIKAPDQMTDTNITISLDLSQTEIKALFKDKSIRHMQNINYAIVEYNSTYIYCFVDSATVNSLGTMQLNMTIDQFTTNENIFTSLNKQVIIERGHINRFFDNKHVEYSGDIQIQEQLPESDIPDNLQVITRLKRYREVRDLYLKWEAVGSPDDIRLTLPIIYFKCDNTSTLTIERIELSNAIKGGYTLRDNAGNDYVGHDLLMYVFDQIEAMWETEAPDLKSVLFYEAVKIADDLTNSNHVIKGIKMPYKVEMAFSDSESFKFRNGLLTGLKNDPIKELPSMVQAAYSTLYDNPNLLKVSLTPYMPGYSTYTSDKDILVLMDKDTRFTYVPAAKIIGMDNSLTFVEIHQESTVVVTGDINLGTSKPIDIATNMATTFGTDGELAHVRYEPKLNHYPIRFGRVITPSGTSDPIHYNMLKSSEVIFSLYQSLNPDNTVVGGNLVNNLGANSSGYYQDTIYNSIGFEFASDDILPNATNEYKQFLISQSSQFKAGILTGAAKAIGGGLLGGVFSGSPEGALFGGSAGAVGVGFELVNKNAMIKDKKRVPEKISGLNNIDTKLRKSLKPRLVTFIPLPANESKYLALFIKYGYTLGTLYKISDIYNTRTRFNYIKTAESINDYLDIQVSNNVKGVISQSFQEGVRVWHYHKGAVKTKEFNFNNYELENWEENILN